MRRSEQRREAVIALYQHDLTGRDLQDTLPAGASGFVRALAAAAIDHRPELDWKKGGTAPGLAAARGQSPKPESVPEPRPAFLLNRPQRLIVEQGAPVLQGALELIAGPERIESGWWDGGDVRRDYYLIETAAGQRAWAYRPVGEEGPLMLQGWFA